MAGVRGHASSQSTSATLLSQKNGKSISWRHLHSLYQRDQAGGVGIRLLPKLKYEHLNLTSFSKMRVDLAAQVYHQYVP